ncbi:MAG: hypothetical protein IPM56_17930 [Ignavibacteriales bacterium]|nr:MAG: hypothetical protein IPM56_17930 [Ignavibacteriales bacterium]
MGYLSISNDRKIKYYFIAATLIISFYSTYTAFYPTESFYESEFTFNTKITFPSSAKFLFKDASYPDIHGDYISIALIEVSTKDYHDILSVVRSWPASKQDDIYFQAEDKIQEILGNKINYNYEACTLGAQSNSYFFIRLLDDGKSIIFKYVNR